MFSTRTLSPFILISSSSPIISSTPPMSIEIAFSPTVITLTTFPSITFEFPSCKNNSSPVRITNSEALASIIFRSFPKKVISRGSSK